MSASQPSRQAYVTNLVSRWIESEPTLLEQARLLLVDPGTLASWLSLVLQTASPLKRVTLAAWLVRQELAPNDYGRIDWSAVVQSVRDSEA